MSRNHIMVLFFVPRFSIFLSIQSTDIPKNRIYTQLLSILFAMLVGTTLIFISINAIKIYAINKLFLS